MLRRGCLHLTVALGGTDGTHERTDGAVRLKLSDYRAEERLQGTEVHLQVEVRATGGLVGRKLSVAVQSSDTFLITDARSASHVLQSFLNADDGQHEEVFAVFPCRILVLLESE